MTKEQRNKLRQQFPVSLIMHFKEKYYVDMEVENINAWCYENSYEEYAKSFSSTYGFHILMSDSEFLKEKTV